MLEPIFSFFEKLIVDFTWKRLLFFSLLICALTGSVIVYEWYSSHLALNRIERELKLLDQILVSSKNSDIKLPPTVQSTYDELAKDLNDIAINRPISFGKYPAVNAPPWLRKGFFALLPWLLLGFVMLFVYESDRGSVLIGIYAVAIPLTIGGIILPDFSRTWINQWAYPWLSFALVLAAILLWHKKSTA